MDCRWIIRLNDHEIVIDQLPDRKRPCLLIKKNGENSYWKVASFNDQFSADYFVNYVREMFKRRVDD